MSDVEAFYADLAGEYHFIFADWERSVREYSAGLDRLIREAVGDRPARVLDATAGIGTQAIGLALQGHEVHANDLSATSIDRARREAQQFGVELAFSVADVRELAVAIPGTFDVVLSLGNSLPHLLTDDDLRRALAQLRGKLRPGGLLLVSTRDYDALAAERPPLTPPTLSGVPGDRAVTFQVWDWAADGSAVDPTLFVIRQQGAHWTMTARTMRYRALRRADLERLLGETGFVEITWESEERARPLYPLVTARCPKSGTA